MMQSARRMLCLFLVKPLQLVRVFVKTRNQNRYEKLHEGQQQKAYLRPHEHCVGPPAVQHLALLSFRHFTFEHFASSPLCCKLIQFTVFVFRLSGHGLCWCRDGRSEGTVAVWKQISAVLLQLSYFIWYLCSPIAAATQNNKQQLGEPGRETESRSSAILWSPGNSETKLQRSAGILYVEFLPHLCIDMSCLTQRQDRSLWPNPALLQCLY